MSNHFPNYEENGVFVPKQLVKRVRRFIQDYAEVNELFDGEENSDMKIAEYIVDAVDEWNVTPPINNASFVNPVSLAAVPSLAGVGSWIVQAAGARILKSVIIKLGRNDMPFTAGNTTIQTNAVWRNLQPIVQDIELQYKEFRTNFKIAKNAESAYGASQSELYSGIIDEREGFIVVGF